MASDGSSLAGSDAAAEAVGSATSTVGAADAAGGNAGTGVGAGWVAAGAATAVAGGSTVAVAVGDAALHPARPTTSTARPKPIIRDALSEVSRGTLGEIKRYPPTRASYPLVTEFASGRPLGRRTGAVRHDRRTASATRVGEARQVNSGDGRRAQRY
ncbi:MAG: hypothetical protein LC797_21150 [Chloroflexi bacterium]|nr:hypothetical protein [Chloroflexota bacterium]